MMQWSEVFYICYNGKKYGEEEFGLEQIKEILFICIILAEMNVMLALLGCMCSRKEILFMSSMVKLNNKFLRFILHFNLNKLIKL